jgi:hypothetical protein
MEQRGIVRRVKDWLRDHYPYAAWWTCLIVLCFAVWTVATDSTEDTLRACDQYNRHVLEFNERAATLNALIDAARQDPDIQHQQYAILSNRYASLTLPLDCDKIYGRPWP